MYVIAINLFVFACTCILRLSLQISPAQPGEPLKKSQFPTEDDDDGDDHPQTIILSNAQDKFVLDQVFIYM